MDVARVDVASESGREVAARFGVRALPTYLLLDGAGRVVYQQVGGTPDAAEIERRLPRGP